MLKPIASLNILCALLLPVTSLAQGPTIPVTDNLVAEDIPPLPASLIGEVRSYTESRGASLAAWHPARKEMIISTRFGNTSQLHLVKFPGGARTQITFYEDAVGGANFEPTEGRYFLFSKDAGGNEFSQLYRMDADGKATLLTDGKRSQNGGGAWSRDEKRIAYSSTMRNGKDRDIRIMDPLNPASDRVAAENAGGGWGVSDWSADDKQLLMGEGLSVNESRIYLLDIATGEKTRLLPVKDERTTYRPIAWNADGTGIFLISNKDSEFNRLCIYDLRTRKLKAITANIPWDVAGVELTHDRSRMAFTTNEDGLSKLYIMDASTLEYAEVPNM
ncbi:MAG TPA: S9 family peptidase, partial [Flavobacteriales bacterium]|nr:S9 family peptidase [Flavobacteriales bacterium]